MSDKTIDRIVERLDRIIELLEGSSIKRGKTKAKKEEKSYRGEMETIEGKIKNVDFKEGARCGEFAVFTLESYQKGAISCKCFDSKLLDIIDDNLEVRVSGNFQEYNGYSSFIVRDITCIDSEYESSEKSSNKSSDENGTKDDDEEIPF